ncbi:hypothetical protein BVY03_00930 [bacterium K02(2017)]|nr:hypothetical protein BVY03_00930 [bacterium K02(2017)]
MKDAIIKKLNSRLAEKISNTVPLNRNNENSGASKFDKVLNQKQNDLKADKLTESLINNNANDTKMEVFSAKDIQINIEQGEFAGQGTYEDKNAVSEIFSTINNDALKMDSIIEVLSSSNTRLSRRQLLAYQASIGSLTINTEMFSKLAQSLSQNINTLLQTNMG